MSKASAEIRSLARAHTEAALKTLVGIMNQPKAPPAARVAACNAILDRGWGKPTQPISGDDEGDAIKLISRIERVIVRPDDDEGGGGNDGTPAPA